jgi:hypothetical protein
MQDPGGLVRGVAGELALPPEVPVCEFWHHAASSSPKTTRRSKPMWKRTDPHRLLAPTHGPTRLKPNGNGQGH